MTDSMGPGKLVCHMQNPSYIYDEYLICIGLGPSISSVICKNLSYSGPSYPSSPVDTEEFQGFFMKSVVSYERVRWHVSWQSCPATKEHLGMITGDQVNKGSSFHSQGGTQANYPRNNSTNYLRLLVFFLVTQHFSVITPFGHPHGQLVAVHLVPFRVDL